MKKMLIGAFSLIYITVTGLWIYFMVFLLPTDFGSRCVQWSILACIAIATACWLGMAYENLKPKKES
jgi:hypothetical protein